jgi:hypothetical protein
LEKDFQEPEKYIKIFCQYGRFLKIWDDVKRVKIDAEEETERIGKLKQAISQRFWESASGRTIWVIG